MHKNIIALGWVSFFTDTATSMITPLIPILVVVFLQEDVQTLSHIIAIATFISYGFRVLFGYLGDRYQLTKPLVVTGYLISALTKPLFYFASSWQGVAVLQSTERMGKAIRAASKDTLISTFASKNESGKAFGFHKTMDIAGELTGAILIFFILVTYGQDLAIVKTIFAATIIPGLLAVIVVCFFVEDAPAKNKDTRYQWQKQDSALLPLLFVYFAYLFFLFNTSFFVIKATDAEYDIAFIPLFFIVLTLTQTLTSYYFGLRIDKSGVPGMLLFSFLCGVLTQISLYFGMMWLCFVLLGLFTVSSMNAIRVYISQRAINKSTVFGVLYGGTALCSSLGVLLTGYIWSNYSDSLSILVSIIGTSTVLILMFFTRSKLIPVPVP